MNSPENRQRFTETVDACINAGGIFDVRSQDAGMEASAILRMPSLAFMVGVSNPESYRKQDDVIVIAARNSVEGATSRRLEVIHAWASALIIEQTGAEENLQFTYTSDGRTQHYRFNDDALSRQLQAVEIGLLEAQFASQPAKLEEK
jgi:hypothetical protein